MKYAWMQAHSGCYPVARLCRILGVSRTGFLQWRQRPPGERHLANTVLDVQVAAIHAESRQSYGRLRIVRNLRARVCGSDTSGFGAVCGVKGCGRSTSGRIG